VQAVRSGKHVTASKVSFHSRTRFRNQPTTTRPKGLRLISLKPDPFFHFIAQP
jgi:hypothetical protein